MTKVWHSKGVCESHLSSHVSLNRKGRWGTTDDFVTSFLHFPLFSTALWDLANFRPVHSLMLSSHLFLCLPCLLPPFTVPCKVVLARPGERKTWLPSQFASLYDGQEVFMWSDYLLDLGTDFIVGNMVLVFAKATGKILEKNQHLDSIVLWSYLGANLYMRSLLQVCMGHTGVMLWSSVDIICFHQ